MLVPRIVNFIKATEREKETKLNTNSNQAPQDLNCVPWVSGWRKIFRWQDSPLSTSSSLLGAENHHCLLPHLLLLFLPSASVWSLAEYQIMSSEHRRHQHHRSRSSSHHQHSSSSRHHHRHHRRSDYSVRLHPSDDDFSFISPCAKYSLFLFNLVFWVSILPASVLLKWKSSHKTGNYSMRHIVLSYIALKAEWTVTGSLASCGRHSAHQFPVKLVSHPLISYETVHC